VDKCPRILSVSDFGDEDKYKFGEHDPFGGVNDDTIIAWFLLEAGIATKLIRFSLPGDFGFI
jgi:hypothetical protein